MREVYRFSLGKVVFDFIKIFLLCTELEEFCDLVSASDRESRMEQSFEDIKRKSWPSVQREGSFLRLTWRYLRGRAQPCFALLVFQRTSFPRVHLVAFPPVGSWQPCVEGAGRPQKRVAEGRHPQNRNVHTPLCSGTGKVSTVFHLLLWI